MIPLQASDRCYLKTLPQEPLTGNFMIRTGASMIDNKGFTLVELMIVVSIIGILAAIAIPQLTAYRQKAFNAAAETDIRNLKLIVEAVYVDQQVYPY